MALLNYNDIGLQNTITKINKIINFNGKEIQILNYLPIRDKYDLIMITLQKSLDENIYNDIKIKMYFNLHIVYMYTNIVFDIEDKLNEEELYDTLKQSGLLDIILQEMNQEELLELQSMLLKIEVKLSTFKESLLSVILDFMDTLPQKAQDAVELLKQIDPEKMEKIIPNSLISSLVNRG